MLEAQLKKNEEALLEVVAALSALTTAIKGSGNVAAAVETTDADAGDADDATDAETKAEKAKAARAAKAKATRAAKAKAAKEAKAAADADEDDEGDVATLSLAVKALAKGKIAEGIARSEIKDMIQELDVNTISELDLEGLKVLQTNLNNLEII